MAKKQFVCTNCHSIGPAKTITPGSILIEIILWILFILPGILYSAYRLISRKQVCSVCESPNLVPLDSPRGKELATEIEQKQNLSAQGN